MTKLRVQAGFLKAQVVAIYKIANCAALFLKDNVEPILAQQDGHRLSQSLGLQLDQIIHICCPVNV